MNFIFSFTFKANDAAVLSEREPTQVSIFPSELQVRNHKVFKTYAPFMLLRSINGTTKIELFEEFSQKVSGNKMT